MSLLTFLVGEKFDTTNGSTESVENDDALKDDVKAVLEELLCAVEAHIDEEKEPGTAKVYLWIVACILHQIIVQTSQNN